MKVYVLFEGVYEHRDIMCIFKSKYSSEKYMKEMEKKYSYLDIQEYDLIEEEIKPPDVLIEAN